MREVKYREKHGTYEVKHVRNFKNTLMFKLIGFIVSLTLFVLFFLLAFSFNSVVDTLNYTESASTDYNVKLLPNDKYGEIVMSSGSDKAYVSAIIDKVKPQFNYEIHADKNMIVKYKYTISSTLYYNNYSDGKELKRTYNVLDEYESIEDARDFTLRKSTDIDFQKYQEEIKSYKQYFQIPVKAKLVINYNLSIIGIADNYSDTITKNVTQSVTIPIGELTTDITIDSKNYTYSGRVDKFEKISINNMFFALLDVIFLMGTVYFFVLVIKKVIILYNKIDIYDETLRKILSNYDSVIVSGKMEINEDNYDNIIFPNKFEEMVDASMNVCAPILFYEVVPGEKAFFIIVKDNTMYKYIVSREKLEGDK
jgi:hypothetical protein